MVTFAPQTQVSPSGYPYTYAVPQQPVYFPQPSPIASPPTFGGVNPVMAANLVRNVPNIIQGFNEGFYSMGGGLSAVPPVTPSGVTVIGGSGIPVGGFGPTTAAPIVDMTGALTGTAGSTISGGSTVIGGSGIPTGGFANATGVPFAGGGGSASTAGLSAGAAAALPALAFAALAAPGLLNRKPPRPMTDLGQLDKSNLVKVDRVNIPRGAEITNQGSAGAGFINAPVTLANGAEVTVNNLNKNFLKSRDTTDDLFYDSQTGQLVSVKQQPTDVNVHTTSGHMPVTASASGGATPLRSSGWGVFTEGGTGTNPTVAQAPNGFGQQGQQIANQIATTNGVTFGFEPNIPQSTGESFAEFKRRYEQQLAEGAV